MTRDGRSGILERSSGTLYLVAGGLLVGNATLLGYEAFAGSATPEDVFGPPGFLIGFLGLFGVYAALADREPIVARIALVAAVVGATGWATITPFSVGGELGLVAGDQLPFAVVIVAWLATVLAYSLFGVASLRAGAHSRAVGILLLAPALLIVALILGAGAFGQNPFAPFVIGSGQAIAHLAIGVTLRKERGSGDTSVGRTDPAT